MATLVAPATLRPTSAALTMLVVAITGCERRFNDAYCLAHGDDPRYAMYCHADAATDVIPDGPPGTYRVIVRVDGLLIGTVVLENNAADDLSIAMDGTFFFATPLAIGSPYDVLVKTQPMPQMCTVINGNGTVGQADVDLAVHCMGDPGIQCGSTSCLVGDACCYVEGVCNSMTACSGIKLYCDDSADCGGTSVCCGEVKSATQKKQAVCVDSVAACMAGDPGNEILCDPAGDAACAASQQCLPSNKFVGYHDCH